MDVQERAKLIRDLRTLLYMRDPEVLVTVADSVQPGGATGAEEAIDLLEKIITNSEKEEDGGKDLLRDIHKILSKDIVPKVVQTSPKETDMVQKVEASPNIFETNEKPVSSSLKLETLKKDFKFSGQIGDNTNCMGYTSFLRQVAIAVKRGYSNADIVDGVISAIHPTARIRGYLEGRESLILPTLQTIIRSYYKEKTSNELYQELCTLAQLPKESAKEFPFRTMELRQKILFASKENTSLSYEAKLVEQQFRHTVATGLRDDMIHAEFQNIL